MLQKSRKAAAGILAACMAGALAAFPAYAAEGSDLEQMAQEEHLTTAGVFDYPEETLQVVVGEAVGADGAEETTAGASVPVTLADESGNTLLVRHVSFELDGDAGSYCFSETGKWSWYTTDTAEGVLLGGVTNTVLSATEAQHTFSWYDGEDSYRTTITFRLDESTGTVYVSQVERTAKG